MHYSDDGSGTVQSTDTEQSSVESFPGQTSSYKIYQQSQGSFKSKPEGKHKPFHECPQEPVLQILLAITQRLWKESILESSLEHLMTASHYITHGAASPMEDVPILFAVTGSSSLMDSFMLYTIFSQCFHYLDIKRRSVPQDAASKKPTAILYTPLGCKTVYDLIRGLTEKLNATESCQMSPFEPLLSTRKSWILDFFNALLPFSTAPLVILIPNAENLPKTLLTTLIQLCYQARQGNFTLQYPAFSTVAQQNHKRIASKPLPVIPVALVFGVSLSTVNTLQQNWGPETMLKTFTTSVHIFNLRDTIRLATNKLVSHLYITSLLEIPYHFLSTLVDEVHQFSRSFEYFQHHVERYLTVIFSLVYPILVPLLVPIHIVFIDNPSSNTCQSVASDDGQLDIDNPQLSPQVLCPTIVLKQNDGQDVGKLLHSGLEQVYSRLAMASPYLKQLNQTPERLAKNTQRPERPPTRDNSLKKSEFSAHITSCIIYFCMSWRRQYVLSLVTQCIDFDHPLLHIVSLHPSSTSQILLKDLVSRVDIELQKIESLDASNQQIFIDRLRSFFLHNTTHWQLWLAVSFVGYEETKTTQRTVTKSSTAWVPFELLQAFMLEPCNFKDVNSVKPIFMHLIKEAFHVETRTVTFISQKIYQKAWKITTNLLNPPLGDSLKKFYEDKIYLTSSPGNANHPTISALPEPNVFVKDFFIFYAWLLQKEKKDTTDLVLESWFITFCKIVLAKHRLVPEQLQNEPTVDDKKSSLVKKKTNKNQEKTQITTSPLLFNDSYGCLTACCIWKRFLLCLETLILLGLVSEPYRSRSNKSTKKTDHDIKTKESCCDSLPQQLKEYRQLLHGLECKQYYTRGEELGFA